MQNKKIFTLCVIHNHPRVLLGMKKRGFGMGRWNGFGGKVEKGEEIEAAAQRELQEEAGITAKKLEKMGILHFVFKDDPIALEVHVFRGNEIEGEPRESEEMKPEWFDIKDIPFAAMWPDDTHWLPLLLSGKKFTGRFLFEGQNEIKDMNLIEINPPTFL